MKILLDTHILLWHLTDNPKLSHANSQLIEDPQPQKFFSQVGWANVLWFAHHLCFESQGGR